MWRFISFLFIELSLTVMLASAQTNCPEPRYPSLARQARIQGVVEVEFDIAKDGTVIKSVTKSGLLFLRKELSILSTLGSLERART